MAVVATPKILAKPASSAKPAAASTDGQPGDSKPNTHKLGLIALTLLVISAMVGGGAPEAKI